MGGSTARSRSFVSAISASMPAFGEYHSSMVNSGACRSDLGRSARPGQTGRSGRYHRPAGASWRIPGWCSGTTPLPAPPANAPPRRVPPRHKASPPGISPRAEKRPHPLGQQIPPPQRRHSVRQICPRLRHSHSHSTTPQCPTVSCPKNAPCARSRIYSNPASLPNPPARLERRRRALRHRHPTRSARPDRSTRTTRSAGNSSPIPPS